MSPDLGIADRLRGAGLRVIECDGWRERFRPGTWTPHVYVMHHTAAGGTQATPSLSACINGKPGVSGPLVQVLQSREPDGNDIFYVISAGIANHAGEGGWKGYSGNSNAAGIEIEHDGVSPLSVARQKLNAHAAAALMAPYNTDEAYFCRHAEWAPTRKIDAAQQVDGPTFRGYVHEAFHPTTPPPVEAEMWVIERELPGGTPVAPGDLIIGLPPARNTCRVDFWLDAPSSEGAQLWAAQTFQGGAEAIGLWSGGNIWTLWLPGHYNTATGAIVAPTTAGLHLQNQSAKPVRVIVSGT